MDRALLTAGDEAELERFLVAHADSAMFLRGNSRAAGLVDRGQRYEGTYVAAREDGAIVAVAACYWNGNVMVEGRVDAVGELAREAVARSGRAVRGLLGPYAQVVAARAALGLADRATRLDSREDLFALALADLRVPPPLADGRVACRHAAPDDAPTLAQFDAAYRVEALGDDEAPVTPDDIERLRAQLAAGDTQFVLLADGALVATMRFTAVLPDAVQIGGVFTPRSLRGRGHARAVVAGALLDARARGVTRSILFTDVHNAPARHAYLALGYRIVGDYAIVLFD